MASLTVPKHFLPTLLQRETPKYLSSENLPFLPRSSNSQFCGLKLSHFPSFSIPPANSSTYSLKGSIFAKACAFRDSYEKFKNAGAEFVGIGRDDTASHKGNKLRKEWGVPGDFFGALPGRQTYVIDRSGVAQLICNNQFQPEKHIDETLKLLQSL